MFSTGVYQVTIDPEQQKVTVSGGVDSATLIKKLIRAGKHAELWSQKANQNQKQKANCIKDGKNNKGQKQQGQVKGLETVKNQQKFPFYLEEDEDCLDDEEDGDDDEEDDELRFLREKANQINMLRQQAAAMQGNNGKKSFGQAMAASAAASGNGKMNNGAGNGNAAKKGNHPNENMGMKANPGGIDQKTMAALNMQNAQFAGGANINPGEGKMGNEINSMMNLAGFHGNGANNFAAVLGGNSGTGSGGVGVYHHQIQPNGFMGASATAGFPTGGMPTGHHPSSMMMNMNGGYQQQHQQQQYNNHPSSSSILMNLQNRHAMQQPQMMYNRSPYIPTSSGYYYSYGPQIPPYHAYMSTTDPSYYGNNGDQSATTHMFSDENTSSCSIM